MVVVIAVLLATVAAIVPSFQGSNCGGNTAALHDVRLYEIIARAAVAENADHEFRITTATPQQREWLAEIANDFWIGSGRFLVSPKPYRERSPGPCRVIIVCDRPFQNVPRQVFGTTPPTHAAAFSDGTCRLISVAEFKALDRSTLVPLDELLASLTPPARGR